MDETQRPRPMAIDLPLGSDPSAVRRRLEALEGVLERGLTIPGTNRQVGLDAVIGLVPVVGDVIAAAIGSYLIWEARNLGLPKWKLARMVGNLGFDTAIGAVPLLGDAFDLFFRSNSRNLRIVKRHLDKHHPATKIIEG
jgi:hypothetical protein